MYYADFKFSVYFLKFLQFFLFGQIWSKNLEFSKQTVIWHRNILLYVIMVLMFIFSKCSPFNFWTNLISKSCYNCLKRFLQLLHAKFFVFLNDPYSTQAYIVCTLHKQRNVRKGMIYRILATLLGWWWNHI